MKGSPSRERPRGTGTHGSFLSQVTERQGVMGAGGLLGIWGIVTLVADMDGLLGGQTLSLAVLCLTAFSLLSLGPQFHDYL